MATVVVLIWTSTDHFLFQIAVSAVAVVVAVVILVEPRLFTDLPVKAVGLPIGLEIEFREREGERETEFVKVPESVAQRWLAVRWKLEMKLVYLSKHILPHHLPLIGRDGDQARPFANIGSLTYDKLLDEEDARIATTALSDAYRSKASRCG